MDDRGWNVCEPGGIGAGILTRFEPIAGMTIMIGRTFARYALAVTLGLGGPFAAPAASAQDTIKVGLVLPLTGAFTSTGRQIAAGARLYMQQNGAAVGGKTVELILRDDAGIADNTRRIAQELLVNDKVHVLAGFGLTPLALAAAPLSVQTKVPMVVMGAATSFVTERSPYIVRTSFAQAQPVVIIADWVARNGVKRAMTMVSDFAPGYDSETFFKERFTAAGGQIVDSIRVPLQNPDYAPFLQRVRDVAPDGLFAFVPAGQTGGFFRQFVERGLDKAGVRLFGAAACGRISSRSAATTGCT